MLGVVPHERGDPLVTGDAEAAEGVRQLGGLRAEIGVAEPAATVGGPRHDLLVGVQGGPVAQELRDQQRCRLHGALHAGERVKQRALWVGSPAERSQTCNAVGAADPRGALRSEHDSIAARHLRGLWPSPAPRTPRCGRTEIRLRSPGGGAGRRRRGASAGAGHLSGDADRQRRTLPGPSAVAGRWPGWAEHRGRPPHDRRRRHVGSVGPPELTGLQFRDVEATSDRHAVILSVGNGTDSRIYVTDDGGGSWTWPSATRTGRRSTTAWRSVRRSAGSPSATRSTERSGSRRRPTAATPGRSSTPPGCRRLGRRVRVRGQRHLSQRRPEPDDLPRLGRGGRAAGPRQPGRRSFLVGDHGATAKGAAAGTFSVRFRDRRNGIALGGDFGNPTSNLGNAAWSDDGGSTWDGPRCRRPGTGPGRPGYPRGRRAGGGPDRIRRDD